MKKTTFIALILYSAIANGDGFEPHLDLKVGFGGCRTSNGGIHACEEGVTNQIAIELEWYRKGDLYLYSDRRHTSRLESEDLDPNEKGPSGSIDTWCYLCLGYRFF